MAWVSPNLPPSPIRKASPEQCAELSAMMDAELARYFHGVELRERRKVRTTPEQRARKAAQDDVRKLRAILRETADAARWERITAALDVYGMQADGAKAKADRLRDKVTERTRRVYQRAAEGCMISAAFLADESADDLYRQAFNEPAAPVPDSHRQREL
jgi:hypothetical protein